MDEKKEETKKEVSESPEEKPEEGIVSELNRADQIAERQKRENDRREKLLEREEALEARRAVGGRAEAGGEAPKEPEISDKEYAEKALSGELDAKKD